MWYIVSILNLEGQHIGYLAALEYDWYESYSNKDALTHKKEFASQFASQQDAENDAKNFISQFPDCSYKLEEVKQ